MSSSSPNCEYLLRPDGIHELIYHSIGREAVDAYFDHFEHLIAETPPGAVMRVLTDGRRLKQTQPVTYLLSRTRIAISRAPHRPVFRVGIVSYDTSMVTIMDNMFRILIRGRDKLRFFGASHYDNAITWLLQEP